jgi:hypothetical protein
MLYLSMRCCDRYHINYTETSALSNTNIEESLAQCVKQVIHQMDNPTLIGHLRDKLKKGDSKSRLSSGDGSRAGSSSTDKRVSAERSAEPVTDPTASTPTKTAKERDCVIS